MVSKIWDVLFSYADAAKEHEDDRMLEIIRALEMDIQKVWDDGETFRTELTTVKPRNLLEEIVLSVPSIRVYKDKQDNAVYYELGNRHMDTPREVIKFLIDFYEGEVSAAMAEEKAAILSEIQKRIKAVSPQKMKKKQVKIVKDSVVKESK